LATAGPYLNSGGAILIEIGAGQGLAALALAHGHFPQAQIVLRKDYGGLDRLLVVETGAGHL